MKTQTITAQRMAAAGIQIEDAMWFLTTARPRDFKGPGDGQRAANILQKLNSAKH